MSVRIHLRTVKTQMKCCIMRRFIRIYTACNKYINNKKGLQIKDINYSWRPYIYPIDRPWSAISGKRVEAISFQRANSGVHMYI